VSGFWNPFELGMQIPPEFRVAGGMVWMEGRIWFHGYDLSPDPPGMRHYIFALDPISMKTETYPLPPGPAPRAGVTPDAGFVITTNYFIVSALEDFLGIYDRSTRKWDLYREIKPSGPVTPEVLGDQVFLLVKEGASSALVGLRLKQRTTKLLASNRRRPAEGPLDDPDLQLVRFWKNDTDEVVVVAQTSGGWLDAKVVVHGWSPRKQE